MPLDIQYDILEDAPASASPVEANFNRIEQYVNQDVINRDGTVAMTGQLKLAGDPVEALDAIPKQFVDAILPIGIIMMYGGVAVPPGGKWALCNGAELESALYPELFAVVSTAYSQPGTPAGRFNLPNLTDRFGIGAGSIASLGKTGGSRDQVVPAHSHSIDHAHPAAFTALANGDHVHTTADHLHSIHMNTGTESVLHTHGSEVAGGQFMTYGVGGAVKAGSGTTIPFVGPYSTGAQSALHVHLVSGMSGAADRILYTTGQSANHNHQFTTPQMTGRSADEGVAATDTNLPPYVGVTYIIRVH